jgi:natural product biosynthesis luciferase-like monooxygenase protein
MAVFSCFLIGSGSLLQECGDILRGQNHTILGVISDVGRLQKWARQCNLEVIEPSSDYASVLGKTSFDYLFSIAHLEKLPDRVLELPRRCAINFHDGPLPRYAGLNAPAWALMNQEPYFGVCWHRMTGAIDRGPVLKRETFAIDPEETAVSLNTKCLAAGMRTFSLLVADLASDAVLEEAEARSARSYFGRYRRPAAASLIDWNRSGPELGALVRGLQFGPYPNPLGSPKILLKDTAYIVTDAGPAHMQCGPASAGEIIDATGRYLRVATGNGEALELSGLSDLRGQAMDIGQLGLRPGARLAALPDLAERLSELDAILCRSEAFWTDRLATLIPVAAPLSRSPVGMNGGANYIRRRLRLPLELRGKFSPGVTEVALLAMLLARVERQLEFDVAVSDARWSRRISGLESVIANEACCRVRVLPEVKFDALAQAVGVELEQLRERGTWLHDLFARQPALRVAPANAGTARLPVGIALVEKPDTWKPVTPRALTLICAGDRTAPVLVGDARQFSDAAFETLVELFQTLATSVAVATDRTLLGLPLVDQGTFQRVVHEWNRTETPYPTSACIHSQIEEQARQTPERTALVFEDTQLSYRALNERANQLAARLIELGVGPELLVGVHLSRSINMVIATLAVLKAGGAYVPLDPRFPIARIGFMMKDAGLTVILTEKALRSEFGSTDAQVIPVDDGSLIDAAQPTSNPAARATAANLAYVIYTSGSTGRPKGVMVEHRNVMNFFTAMDACIDHDPPGTWLAVTSLSFDISVLELLWTLARGFKVVIQGDVEGYFERDSGVAHLPMGFSLFMWGNDDAPGYDKYRLMLEGAKYFDRNGFEAVWTPERHFHAFGGPYPNPSITGAALAAVTDRIGIRAGSCVSPLHHPIRIAEEWAVVDNLSNGRVALAFASGWQPNDFVLRPENHANNKGVMLEQIDQVRRLWRGEKVSFRNPLGQDVQIGTLPRPVQPELPFWVTTAGNPDTYRQAGELGANVLTHLLGQSVDEVAEKIAIYRQARAAAGHDPATGRVTLMLHTFVGNDDTEVRELIRQPMKDYLRSSLNLVLNFAWSFPAFKRPGGAEKPQDVDLRSLPDGEVEALLDFAFERYFETSGLFGTPSTCASMAERCKRAGVDEIACLMDFGVPTDRVLASLPYLNEVRERSNLNADKAPGTKPPPERFSVAAQIERHGVTHLQCTPSLAGMLLRDQSARTAMARIHQMLVGGEALSTALARELKAAIGGQLRNMYGPTETTVWSATHPVVSSANPVPIGHPLGNTQLYILDGFGQPLPTGVPGELFIGGAGVTRGYLHQPGLTSERFSANRFLSATNARLYRTGDLARFLPDGSVEFLGRVDQQVKIRGYRVELEEIESLLIDHPDVEQAAVIAHSSADADVRLIAYLVAARNGDKLDLANLRHYLRRQLPDYMVPGEFVILDRLPLTPNGKVDRKALLAPENASVPATVYIAPATPNQRTLAEVWQDVFRIDRIGIADSFFDLGGHSLLALQIVSRVRQEFGVELSLRNLFERPTVAALAEVIDMLSWSAQPKAPSQRAANREEILL